VLVEPDHNFPQDKHEGCVDDKRQLEAVLAKILDQALEQFQDDKKGQKVSDDKTEGVFERALRHDRPSFQKHFHQAHHEHKHDKEDEQFEKQIDYSIKYGKGIHMVPLPF